MTVLPKSRTVDWHWFALLSITVLVNVPMLPSSLLFANDSLHALIFFHFAYANFFLHHEVPQWIPYLAYGVPFDFNLFNTILPTDYVMMTVGWVLRIRDSLLLYKMSMILCQGILVLGLYGLSRKLITSMMTVWMVCLGALLTTNWIFCVPWSLTSFYMLPLVLWFVLRFLENKNPAHLWLAGLVEGLSLLGTIPYIAPIHLLIVVVFLVPFLCREPGLARAFLNWRNFIHPLFFVFCTYYLLLVTWIIGFDVAWLAPSRDRETGNVPLKVFLDPVCQRQPLGVMLRVLARGDIYYGDFINYVGILPLGAVLYALLRRRDTYFLSIAAVVLALFWFSLGGGFTELCYHGFPMMKKYRFISAVWNFLRIFLLLLGGLGFDQILRDLRGQPAPPPRVFSRRERWVICILLACCGLDHAVHSDVDYYTSNAFVFNNKRWPELFSLQSASLDLRQKTTTEFWIAMWEVDRKIGEAQKIADPRNPESDKERRQAALSSLEHLTALKRKLMLLNQILLSIRYLAYAAALCGVWLLLKPTLPNSSPSATRPAIQGAAFVGPLLLAVFLADVSFFYSQFVKQSPFCPPDTSLGNSLTVHESIYRPQRYEFADMPADARLAREIIFRQRGSSGQNNSASAYVFMQCDPIEHDGRKDLIMECIIDMMAARTLLHHAPVERSDIPFRRSLGGGLDKARMIRESDVVFAENGPEALAIYQELLNPDQKIVIQGKRPSAQDEEPTADIAAAGASAVSLLGRPLGQGHFLGVAMLIAGKPSLGEVKSTYFSANRAEFKLPEGASGWLYYADAYHPGWKALVDGKPARVFQANIGFKAVHVPKGTEKVTFYFERGWRDVHGLALIVASALLAFMVTGWVVAGPWLLKIGGEAPSLVGSFAPEADPNHLRLLRIWSALGTAAMLVAALLMYR
jgi:hypothetical protein